MLDVKILVAIPVKKGLNDKLREKMQGKVSALQEAHPEVDVCIHENEPIVTPVRGSSSYVMDRAKNLANARNLLLDHIELDKYTHILWIDADIVKYSVDLPYHLLSVSQTDIVAPMLLIEGTNVYYDTYTHIEAWGRPADPHPPYFYSQENLVEMQCVGGCYIIPAEIFKTTRYQPYGGPGMEHYYLMEAARRQNYKIYVTRNVKIYHANLPAWGEEFH